MLSGSARLPQLQFHFQLVVWPRCSRSDNFCRKGFRMATSPSSSTSSTPVSLRLKAEVVAGQIIDCGGTGNGEGEFYEKAAQYWGQMKPTVDDMLGGFGTISGQDIDSSAKFLKKLFKMEEGAPGKDRALDCGAGIGRISRNLLKRHFKTVDLVEQNRTFLEKATEYVKNNEGGRFFCCGLQNFSPEPESYDVIWCQWVLGHLTDDHLVDLFKRCSAGLRPNGVLVVKENLTSSGEVEPDDDDSSVTRPESLLLHLLQDKAGLVLVDQMLQTGFPEGLYKVKMFAFRPPPR